MPWYYECDMCGYRVKNHPDYDITPARSCEDCGMDGCDGCMEDNVCELCQAHRQAENEEDGYGL